MNEIDWEAAKSGKRPYFSRPDGAVGRYLGPILHGRHAVALRFLPGGEEWVAEFLENGDEAGMGGANETRLTQDPEVIEFKRWVNVSPHYVEGLFDDLRSAAWSASESCLANVLVTIRITGDKVEIFGGTE